MRSKKPPFQAAFIDKFLHRVYTVSVKRGRRLATHQSESEVIICLLFLHLRSMC